ncbi:MAG TPA: hypothetical protein VNJ08_08680 [Bacteriovoracaceae bacterium]|nr:hypothetical protein [Bacteriovoracaceae bacterium]
MFKTSFFLKNFFLVILIAMTVSCREEVAGWSSLSVEEQASLTERAKANCLTDNSVGYNNFKSTSDDNFATTTYNRGQGFFHQYKLDTAEISKSDIQIWKQDPNGVIYFYITETPIGGTASSYFLKVKDSENDDMIDQLKIDQCARYYTSASIGEDGPLTVVLDYTTPTASDSFNYIDTYTLGFNKFAFMAAYQMTRKEITKDIAGTVVGTAKVYTATYVDKDYPAFGSNNYADTTFYTQKFCELALKPGETVFRLFRDLKGFSSLTCTSSVPAEWDLSI